MPTSYPVGAPIEGKTGAVSVEISTYNNLLDRLANVISDLENHIARVLSPVPPSNITEKQPASNTVPLAGEIEAANMRLRGQIDRLDHVISRIEI